MKPEAKSAMLRQSVTRPTILYISTGDQLHASRTATASHTDQLRTRLSSGGLGTGTSSRPPASDGLCVATDIQDLFICQRRRPCGDLRLLVPYRDGATFSSP